MSKNWQKPRGFPRVGLGFVLCAAGFAANVGPAWADCSADTSGIQVNCSGTTASYTNTAAGLNVTADSTTVATGPLVFGDTAAVTNSGSIAGVSGSFTLQTGANSSITNNGTITAPYAVAGSGAVLLGDNSTLTNNGSLTAVSGYPVAQFGKNGTFINSSTATAAVTGNIVFGSSTGTDVSTFQNQNSSYGITGNVTSAGNTNIDNAGPLTGNITQTAAGGSVSFTNEAAGTFYGQIQTGDVTNLVNTGTMTISTSSTLNLSSGLGASVVNAGTLNIGTTTRPTLLQVNGSFVQTSGGTLNVILKGSTVAGASYSQVYAAGPNGTATLAGTLNVTAAPVFYPNGSVYNVVLADKGITGTFGNVTASTVPFLTFIPEGVVTLAGGQQAYQIMVQRTSTFTQVLSSVGTPNQLAVAGAMDALASSSATLPTSDGALLIGQADALTADQAQAFFDNLSPAGYLAYANAMRDQTNLFHRKIAMRLNDNHSDEPGQGMWLSGFTQLFSHSASGSNTQESGWSVNGGYDFSGDHYVFGLAFGYSQDPLHYGQGNLNGNNTATQFGGYGAYHAGQLSVTAIVSYQFGSVNATRTMTAGTATRTATANVSDHLLSATGLVGGDFETGTLNLRPFIGVQISRGSISPFTEAGASAADLNISRISANRTDMLAGAEISSSHGFFQPFAKLTYRSQLGSGGGSDVTAFFNGDTTTTFTVSGTPASRHEFDADVGLNLVMDESGSFFVGYQGVYRSDLKTHGIMAGLRMEF